MKYFYSTKKKSPIHLLSLILLLSLIFVKQADAKPQTPKFLKIEVHSATNTKNPTGFYISWSSQRPDNYYFVLEKIINNGNWVEIERNVIDRYKKFYFDQAIVPNMNYCYRVKLKGRYRNEGNPTYIYTESDFTEPVCYKAPRIPLRPSGLVGTIQYPEVGKATLIFNWHDKANNEKGYEIELINKYGHLIKKEYLPANSTALTLRYRGNMIDPLSIRIRTFNMYYSAYSDKITLTPKADLIPEPRNFKLGRVDSKSVRLVWFNPTNYLKIRLQRRNLGKAYQIKKTGIHMMSQFKHYKWVQGNPVPSYYEDRDVKPVFCYEYRISGEMNMGESKFSKIVSVTTANETHTIPPILLHPVPDRPINLRVSLTGLNTVKLYWIDKSNNETGFKIEVKLGNALLFKPLSTTGVNITQFAIKNLKPLTYYSFRIRAFNKNGYSLPSNTVRVRTKKTR